MVQIKASLLAAFLGLAQVNAHFLLNYPSSVGFSDDDEGTAPCGGFSVTYDNSTDFYVDGDDIALTSTHPAAVWLFRATLNQTAGGNFTTLFPAVSQDSLGNFCEQSVKVPSDFAGQKGVIQIIQSATDGLLYQCAAVNFKAGSNPNSPTACKNVTGLSATFTTDPALSTIPAGSVNTGSPSQTTGSSTGSTTASTTSASATKNSAVGDYVDGPIFWGSLLAVGALTLSL